MIPYGHQMIDEQDIAAVVEVLHSDYLTTGPSIERFERKVADYVGAKYAVAVANGTAALHIACLAAGIGKGDEVITSPLTFAASANCVLYCGGKPVFADVDPKTYNISPEEIEKKITHRTKAVIPVHFSGQPCDMEAIGAIARKHNLIVIEDGAHALGASYHGKKIGTFSDMTIFSFHPVKPITTGEGGMVVTDNADLYRKLKLFGSHGITRERSLMEGDALKQEEGWYYQQILLGYNYRMTDFQAALGISQMDKLEGFLEKRREIAERYDAAFSNVAGIVTPYVPDHIESGWHLYVICLLSKSRSKLYLELQNAGIGVNVHYIPVYKHPYYQKHGYANVCCPNAEKLYEQMLTLPIHPGLSVKQQEQVIQAVQGCFLL